MIRALSTRELLSMKRFEELLEHLNNLKLISEWQFGEMLPRSAGRGWAQNLVAPCTSNATPGHPEAIVGEQAVWGGASTTW